MTENIKNDIYQLPKFRVGQTVEGIVVSVTDNEVLVDFHYATEGKIYLNELTITHVESAKELYKVGDPLVAKIKKIDDYEAFLSRLDLEREQVIHKLENKFIHKNVVTRKVVKDTNTALIVSIFGYECIMPKNEVDIDPQFASESLLNETIKVKIIDFEKPKNRVVVSRKLVIAQEMFKEKLNHYKAIEKESIYEGEIIRVESYGLLVVANHYQGLVPLREISHLPFNDIHEIAKVGDHVTVKVIDKNDDKLQVLYSMRALMPKPWEVVSQNIKENDVIEGTIVRITDFGAFVNVYPHVDGLLHKNEYSYNPLVNMFDMIHVGDKINVKVLRIDANREKLSLSIRAIKDDPWHTCSLKPYEIVEMKVIGFEENDALVEYVEDVVGILPKNQVSSERKITKAEDDLTIGQLIKVKVTEFYPEERKLQVSIRRIKEDAERQDFLKYMKEQDQVKNDTIGDLLGDKLKGFLKK